MRLSPQNVNEDCWYYEEPKGICVVLHGETNQGCLIATIPWKMLRGSLKRKDKKSTTRKPRRKAAMSGSILEGRPLVITYQSKPNGGFNFNGEECR